MSNPKTAPAKIAEVVESATTEFVAQCYDLHHSPPFGSLVRVSPAGLSLTTYGLVYLVTTTSIDPGRRPVARGQHEESEEALYRNHPHLTQLLRTEFRALVVGWSSGEALRHGLPAQPPRVHDFVYGCSMEELRTFGASLDYLSLVTAARALPAVDELIAASIRTLGAAQPDPAAFRLAAGKHLARLLSGDSQRVGSVLRALR
ncbi:MAG: hypothetical protein HYX97_01415 [Chloroflexi bacterium]|nr:hypothetical protein [Chloroflexota bacterium]